MRRIFKRETITGIVISYLIPTILGGILGFISTKLKKNRKKEQAIEQGIESGAITEEIIDSIGGKDVLLNAPPTSQLAIFTVSDGHLCVCSGAYFTDEQKEAIIDAIAVAIESIDVIK